MAGRPAPIAREHYTVDTSGDVTQCIGALSMDLGGGPEASDGGSRRPGRPVRQVERMRN